MNDDRDKDHLWKRCDQLVHLLRVQATNQWVSDASIRQCQDCSMRFTLFARRHHCRLCGRIFCHACSNHWLNTAACSKQVRTCRECYSIHWKFSHEPDQLLQNSDQEIEVFNSFNSYFNSNAKAFKNIIIYEIQVNCDC